MIRNLLLGLLAFSVSARTAAAELTPIRDCVLVPTDWADGDSFRVRTPSGEEHTVRLYGVDCLESNVADTTDARRLRAQRRYFGITHYGEGPRDSIELAKRFGESSRREVARVLREPFIVHTAFADARGDGKYRRIYAFVVTGDGRDLGEHLVSVGLARAYGVARGAYDGRSREEYRAHLADLELLAARHSRGVWAETDWESIANERMEQRMEEEELAMATGASALEEGETLDPNHAPRDHLMRLPGIGETLANRIIEGRPYRSAEQLRRVDGIGDVTLERLSRFLEIRGR